MKSADTNKNVLDCLEEIIKAVVNKNAQIDNRQLLEICSNFNIFGGKSDPHFCHEIAESGGALRGSNKTAFKDTSNPNLAKRRASSPPAILDAADHRISGRIPDEF